MPDHDWDICQEALRAPFKPGAEQYRAGPTWERDGVRYTRPLAYIDARAVFDWLDEAVGPGGWSTELERLGPGVYLCRLSVFGATRTDVGMAGEHESEKEKSGASDAIKRAAVQFGIGRYLYDLDLPPVALERRGSDWVLPPGWKPSRPSPERSPERPPARGPVRAVPPVPSGGSVTASASQIARIAAEMNRVGWDEQAGRAYLLETFGKKSRRDLTPQEASAFIDALVASRERPRAL